MWFLPLLLCGVLANATGIRGRYYANTAFAGTPVLDTTDGTVNLNWPNGPPPPVPSDYFSVRWTGVVIISKEGDYSFKLTTSSGLLWIDDEFLWPSDANALSSMHLFANKNYTVRIDYIHSNPNDKTSVQLLWNSTSDPSPYLIPTDVLSPTISAAEEQRYTLMNDMYCGWGTFLNKDMFAHTLLPDSVTFTVGLYQFSSSSFLSEAHVTRAGSDPTVLAGPHSFKGSLYTEAAVNWHQEINLTVQSTLPNMKSPCTPGQADDLFLLLSPQPTAPPMGTAMANLSDYAVVISVSFSWGRGGDIAVHAQAPYITVRGSGSSYLSNISLFATSAPISTPIKVSGTYLAFALDKGSIGISTGSAQSLSTIQSAVVSARDLEYASYQKYGNLSETVEAIQTVLAWLTMYDPHEGITNPVSKGWDFGAGYVLFDWDNYFASYMLAGFPDAKNIAYSNAIQITKAKTHTPDGTAFVPNYSSGTRKSRDRTEPPVGGKVVWEMYQKFKDDWFAELLFDDLFNWNTWFWVHRREAPLGLIALGSDPNPPINGDTSVNTMQGARYESGLDNSPMYDGDFFDNVTTHHMKLYDVGMTGMFLMDCLSLVQLGQAIGRTDQVNVLQGRYNEMANLLPNVWDSTSGIYVNKRSDTGEFYLRLSPTLFFPMLSGAASQDQVSQMITKHMTNNSQFCVRTPAPQPPGTIPLLQYWSSDRQDNSLCLTSKCLLDQMEGSYVYVRTEGFVLPTDGTASTVELDEYWSGQNADNALASYKTPAGGLPSSYNKLRPGGYAYTDSQTISGLVSLDLYYSSNRTDYYAVATKAGITDATTNNYTYVGSLGYVYGGDSPDQNICQYGMPSISKDDPAYSSSDNDYWRGRIWGPHVQLTYWCLSHPNYQNMTEVVTARKNLVLQSQKLLLQEWRQFRHVHENYDPDSGEGCDKGNADPFYHWGALTGFISLLENGYA